MARPRAALRSRFRPEPADRRSFCLLITVLMLLATPVHGDTTVTVKLPAGPVAPANPLGAGYMLNWFERGITDALNDPETGRQLSDALRQLHATALRFPGGSFTYFYPHRAEGLQAFARAGFAHESYNLWDLAKWGWASERAFFEFCARTGITAWYQINPAYLYDAERDTIAQFVPLPRRKVEREVILDPERYLPQALRRVQDLARMCAQVGVEVVWEMGNEDYVYFEPEGYAHIAAAFIGALREVDPAARVALCGDSESWSTREWHSRMLVALKAEGVEHFDFSSVHLYLTGVGERDADGVWRALPRDTVDHLHSSTIRAYQLIRPMYRDFRALLDRAGFGDTRLALTETNPWGPAALPAQMKPYEHSMARALAEAANYPFMVEDFATVFFHDLVRSGPGTGTFFRRLHYDPSARNRYRLPLEAQVMGRVSLHARGQILYRDWDGVCVSAHPWGLYITAGNPAARERTVRVQVADTHGFGRCTTEHVICPGLDAVDDEYDLHRWPGPGMANGEVVVRVPPFSLAAVTLEEPLRGEGIE